jgi:hypothetical protein
VHLLELDREGGFRYGRSEKEDGSRSILRKAIVTHYDRGNHCPTASQILAEIENMPGVERVRGWKITATRALESMEFSDIALQDQISQEQLTSKLLHENTVIELDALAQESKKFLVPLLCLWLYYVRLQSADREKLKLVIFIEEAHHVLHKRGNQAKESVLEMLLRQCRELGIGIVVLDQHPHLLSAAALGNANISICLNQKDPTDINKAAALSLVEEKEYFSRLPVGQGIVKLQDRWTSPFLVQFPLVNVDKGSVTDALLARYSRLNQEKKTGSGRKMSVLPEFARVPQVPLFDKALNEAAFVFLEDIFSFPNDGVKERYKRLGLSTGAGNRLKRQLSDQGWIEAQSVELGRTRKLLLRVGKEGRKALGLDGGAGERASLVHEYWKRFYAARFREQGFKVTSEAPRRSGHTDVLATKDKKTTAVEIETGKSDIARNVKQNLVSGFDRILIVATDEKAMSKVERILGKEGLYIPGRVKVVLRDANDIKI